MHAYTHTHIHSSYIQTYTGVLGVHSADLAEIMDVLAKLDLPEIFKPRTKQSCMVVFTCVATFTCSILLITSVKL